MSKQQTTITTCAECHSQYYAHTSSMAGLCPQCAHVLYGYDNCNHHFENGRCVKCFWDGSVSEYVNKISG